MEVYFVRHGQTSGNAAWRHQAETSPLTTLGQSQAKAVAARVKELEPTHIVTSPLVRAIETASIIAGECGLIPSIDHNVKEIRRPQRLYGNRQFTYDSFSLYIRWYFSKDNESSLELGESYGSLRNRIKQAKENLSRYPEDSRIVIVSHGVFINFFIAHLCTDDRISFGGAFKTFRRIMRFPNTGIIKLHHDPDKEGTCPWSVVQ